VHAVPDGLRLLPVDPPVERQHFVLSRRSARSDRGIGRIVDLLERAAQRWITVSFGQPPK
jgi:hypothetical protein